MRLEVVALLAVLSCPPCHVRAGEPPSPATDNARTSPASPPAASATPGQRQITFNQRRPTGHDLQVLALIERRYGPVPDGQYWYDNQTGAAGFWGGPVAALLPPGLELGGPLPANASGGGLGQLTNVFVNGRELHPYDVYRLMKVMPVLPGRYWWDAAGNIGYENGPFIANFSQLVRQSGRDPYYKSDPSRGESVFVADGCAAVSGRTSPGDSSSSYSYYVGCD